MQLRFALCECTDMQVKLDVQYIQLLIYHWAIIMNQPWWIFGHFWLLKVSIKYSRELCKMLFKRALCERATLEHVGLSWGRRSADRTGGEQNTKNLRQVVLWCSVSSLQIWCWSLSLKSDWLRGNQTRAHSVLSVHLSWTDTSQNKISNRVNFDLTVRPALKQQQAVAEGICAWKIMKKKL